MKKPARYLLDANVFIQAKRRFYGFDFCPGYWQALAWFGREGVVGSIDRIHDELKAGKDDLADWFQRELAISMQKTEDAATVASYREIVRWVDSEPQYLDAARNEFLSIADGWLVAFAKAHGWIVVTLEEHKPMRRNGVPIPTLCLAFGVECIDPFELLRRLRVQLDWLGQRDNTSQLSLELPNE